MGKVYVSNLAVFPTEKCNLNCVICMRGEKDKRFMRTMNDQTIDSIFSKVDWVDNFGFCGGEPFMAPKTILKILVSAMEHNVALKRLSVITNGTLFTENVEEILEVYERYIAFCREQIWQLSEDETDSELCNLYLSGDEYHEAEIQTASPKEFEGYANAITLLTKSKYFRGKLAWEDDTLIDEGKARNMTGIKKRALEQEKIYYTTDGNVTYIGPTITIATDGTVTHCDASYENMMGKYNYGNINNGTLVDIAREIGNQCTDYSSWYAACKAALVKK